MSLKLNGATSGSIELDVPAAIGSDLNITIPATAGEVAVKGTDGSVDLGDVNIDSSGNLGVGTTNPVQQAGIGLHINNAGGQARIKLTQSGSGATANDGFDIIAETSNEVHLLNHEAGALKFGTSDNERMRINDAGNISFNGTNVTTSNGNIGHIYKFFGGANNIILPFETTSSNRYSTFEHRRTGRSGNARCSQISMGENSSNQGAVDIYSSAANSDLSGGVRLVNGATSWSSISDLRLKNVVSYFDNALADVSTLDAFRFTWKNDTNKTVNVGLSAQSVEAVLPEAVVSGKLINALDDDDTDYLSVRYTELIPLLVAALQESKERIESLEAKVAALEANP